MATISLAALLQAANQALWDALRIEVTIDKNDVQNLIRAGYLSDEKDGRNRVFSYGDLLELVIISRLKLIGFEIRTGANIASVANAFPAVDWVYRWLDRNEQWQELPDPPADTLRDGEVIQKFFVGHLRRATRAAFDRAEMESR